MTAAIVHTRRTWLWVLGIALSLAVVIATLVAATFIHDSDSSPAPRVVDGASAHVTPTNYACGHVQFARC